MSVVRLDTIASEFHDKISKDTLSAPVGANGSPWMWRDKLRSLLSSKPLGIVVVSKLLLIVC